MPQSSRPLSRLSAGAALVTLLACSSASAAPRPGYEAFAGCPNVPTINQCITAKINGGSFKLGNVTTPVTTPLTLSGGLTEDLPAKINFTSAGGLTGGPLKVPGGLTGITGLAESFLNGITGGVNNVYATPEIVGQAALNDDGGFHLPIRVKLKNPFLSANCAIGSVSKPITLNLTYGTTAPPLPNRPITGAFPSDVRFDEATQILFSNNATVVDNAFSVPKASGCGTKLGPIYVGLIDDLVNLRVGLPSAAGRNSAIQSDLDVQITGRTDVYGS